VPQTPEEEKFAHLIMLDSDSVDRHAEIIYDNVWFLLGNDTNSLFYIGDHPVTLTSHGEERPMRGVGLATFGAETSMPLTSRLMLVTIERQWLTAMIPERLNENTLATVEIQSVTYYRSLRVRGREIRLRRMTISAAIDQCNEHPDLHDAKRPQWITYAARERSS
jgi:hypothetical protein